MQMFEFKVSYKWLLALTQLLDSVLGAAAFADAAALAKKFGYPFEAHRIITEDGYILQAHRLTKIGGVPVLLVHGLLDSSETWLMMNPRYGLPYLLHNANYDVWLANVRGSNYGRGHLNYTSEHRKFWDYTVHEIGKYDVPVTIDYVLRSTGRQQLHYIGYSQGTTAFWIMASERPAFAHKIILMQALAPIAFLKHTESSLIRNEYAKSALTFFSSFGVDTAFYISRTLCQTFSAFCSMIIRSLVGPSAGEFNERIIANIKQHLPDGVSHKQIEHFFQLSRSGKFRQYDYGLQQNLKRYGTKTPPNYKLRNVRCPVTLYSGNNDWLAAAKDVAQLANRLPNVISRNNIKYQNFNHLDFLWFEGAGKLLYRDMIELMYDYSDL